MFVNYTAVDQCLCVLFQSLDFDSTFNCSKIVKTQEGRFYNYVAGTPF